MAASACGDDRKSSHEDPQADGGTVSDLDAGPARGLDAALARDGSLVRAARDGALPADAASDDAAAPVLEPGLDAGPADAATAPGELEDASSDSDAGDASGADHVGNTGPSACQDRPAQTTCDRCGNANCCEQISACGAACQTAVVCIGLCNNFIDQTCIDACLTTGAPDSVDQFLAVSACLADNCRSECQSP